MGSDNERTGSDRMARNHVVDRRIGRGREARRRCGGRFRLWRRRRIALLCDAIVAGQGAKIGFSVLQSGSRPDYGIAHTLPQRIGFGTARLILMQARDLKSDEALKLGLFDQVVPDADVQSAIDLALARPTLTRRPTPEHALDLSAVPGPLLHLRRPPGRRRCVQGKAAAEVLERAGRADRAGFAYLPIIRGGMFDSSPLRARVNRRQRAGKLQLAVTVLQRLRQRFDRQQDAGMPAAIAGRRLEYLVARPIPVRGVLRRSASRRLAAQTRQCRHRRPSACSASSDAEACTSTQPFRSLASLGDAPGSIDPRVEGHGVAAHRIRLAARAAVAAAGAPRHAPTPPAAAAPSGRDRRSRAALHESGEVFGRVDVRQHLRPEFDFAHRLGERPRAGPCAPVSPLNAVISAK